MRKKRSAKLVRGRCECGKPAYIPWRGHKFCYKCWDVFQKYLREVMAYEREKEKKEQEEKRKKNFIEQSSYFTF